MIFEFILEIKDLIFQYPKYQLGFFFFFFFFFFGFLELGVALNLAIVFPLKEK